MLSMSVAEEVSQAEASRAASDEQPENMPDMLVTDEASQPETSRAASEEHPENV